MTNFEERIKREMTREKFLAIRDHKYGAGNILDFTYGEVSSWFTWNRDEKGEIAKVPPIEGMKKGHYYDGPIDNWDQDKLLPVERQISPRITTDIVFLGLNMSGKGMLPGNYSKFQNARGHRRIVRTFFGTGAEGAYFTDIIKPDKRIQQDDINLNNSQELKRFIEAHRDILKEHIDLFKSELDFIGAVTPLLIVFGNDAEWILEQGMDNDFLAKRFRKVVKIKHYSYRYISDRGYKNDTRKKLEPYITIP